jgi:hypothetical protein
MVSSRLVVLPGEQELIFVYLVILAQLLNFYTQVIFTPIQKTLKCSI